LVSLVCCWASALRTEPCGHSVRNQRSDGIGKYEIKQSSNDAFSQDFSEPLMCQCSLSHTQGSEAQDFLVFHFPACPQIPAPSLSNGPPSLRKVERDQGSGWCPPVAQSHCRVGYAQPKDGYCPKAVASSAGTQGGCWAMGTAYFHSQCHAFKGLSKVGWERPSSLLWGWGRGPEV
jgi:hypothetical protein